MYLKQRTKSPPPPLKKKLVLCILVSLSDVLENKDGYGNTTADKIMQFLNNIFQKENEIKISEVTCHNMFVSTSNGASVSTGTYNGVLTQTGRHTGIGNQYALLKEFSAVNVYMVDIFYYFNEIKLDCWIYAEL